LVKKHNSKKAIQETRKESLKEDTQLALMVFEFSERRDLIGLKSLQFIIDKTDSPGKQDPGRNDFDFDQLSIEEKEELRQLLEKCKEADSIEENMEYVDLNKVLEPKGENE